MHRLEGKPLEETFKGKTVAISGSGNVSQYAALKVREGPASTTIAITERHTQVIELGGIVVSLSDSKGCLLGSLDKGISAADVVAIQALKLKHGSLSDYLKSQANGKTYAYYPGDRPWAKFEKIDVALPCATQNEVSADEAKALVDAGCLIVAEGRCVRLSSTSCVD
jgi:glutamate dehydrogenase (NADP+)